MNKLVSLPENILQWENTASTLGNLLNLSIVVLLKKEDEEFEVIISELFDELDWQKGMVLKLPQNGIFPISEEKNTIIYSPDGNCLFANKNAINKSKYFGMSINHPEDDVWGIVIGFRKNEADIAEQEINIIDIIRKKIEQDILTEYQQETIEYERDLRREVECELNASNEELKAGLERKHDELSKVSKDLKIIEEDYKLIVEKQHALIVKFDKDFKLSYVSPQYAKALGVSETELIGQSFYPLIHPDDIEKVKESHKYLKMPPYECIHEERLKTKSGWQWFLWSNRAIVSENGEIEGVVAVGRDISNRKQYIAELKMTQLALKESEEKNRALSEAASEALFFTDRGFCIECNKVAYEMMGYKYEDMIGIHCTELIANEHRFIVRQNMMSGVEEPYEAKALRKDGTVFWAEFHSRSYSYKNKGVRVTSVKDISKRKAAEDALVFSEEKFRAAFKTSPDCVAINRRSDGLYVEINKGFTRVTGFTEDDVKGKTSEDLNIWVDLEDKRILTEQLNRKGYCSNLEASFRMKNGDILYGLISARVITLNFTPYIISITRDITQLKKVERESILAKELAELRGKEYRDLFNEMLDGFALHKVIYDREGEPVDYMFVDINPAYERLTGLKRNDVKNKTIVEIVPGIEQHWIDNFGKVAKTGEPYWFEDYAEDSNRHYNGLAYCPKKDYFAVIFSDVTDKKNAERIILENDRLLKEQNEEYMALNEELSSLNLELIEAKEKAEESDKLKTAFLANMSHEIRTPMNGIMGFAGLLARDNIDTAKKQKYVEIIKQNSNQLLSIINDLVDISKIEAGQIDLEEDEMNPEELTQSIADFYYQKAKEKDIVFKVVNKSKDVHLIADETKIRQILTNLIENAFKFTSEGEIRFGYEIKDDFVEFYVSDTGIGMEPGALEIIFERFRQVELSSARKYGGTGLGLSISKAYIEKMGGEIWVDSELGKGSTFYFNVPLELNDQFVEEEGVPVSDEELNWDGKLILIAEDEKVNYKYFEEILFETKVNLLWAENGQVAVDKCMDNDAIDLVLMDMKMPLLNGYDATREIKKIKPDLPVIAQTAYALVGDEAKAIQAGCDDYIHKPIDMDVLIDKIAKYLSKK